LYSQLKKSLYEGMGVLDKSAVSMASQTTRLDKGSSVMVRDKCVERVQNRIAYWDKQDNDMPAPNCVLKV